MEEAQKAGLDSKNNTIWHRMKKSNTNSAVVRSKVTPEVKAQAEALYKSMGMSIAAAIRIFLQQSINSNGLPFQPTTKNQVLKVFLINTQNHL